MEYTYIDIVPSKVWHSLKTVTYPKKYDKFPIFPFFFFNLISLRSMRIAPHKKYLLLQPIILGCKKSLLVFKFLNFYVLVPKWKLYIVTIVHFTSFLAYF